MRRGLKQSRAVQFRSRSGPAARAAPYEKGTETKYSRYVGMCAGKPRARPPMRRGLKQRNLISTRQGTAAARAAPYEKGTETKDRHSPYHSEGHAARAAPYEKGTET